MKPTSAATSPDHRRHLMALCADATEGELAAAVKTLAADMEITDLRPPQTGLVMVRGRIGGDGGAFNLGEATVTRAAIRLGTGETGFAYLLGRDAAKARQAAIIDALGQRHDRAEALQDAFIGPVSARLAAERARQREETAATRVNFFTLVRGED